MVGSILGGRYEIESEVGRGGMGVVYRAHDRLLERTVAVKVLPAELRGGELPRRFLQEARVMAQLAHPNIVTVYDVGEAEGTPYFVMEFLAGEPLCAATSRMSQRELLEVLVQVCRALDHAHAHGIVHRDIKPENILLTPERAVKLTDFGLARVLGGERISQAGIALGTFSYMAPEQVLGSEVDGRADLYALGVLLYEFATGQLPFTGDDAVAVISQHLHVAPVAPRLLNPQIDAAMERIILRLLEKDPQARFPSALESARALEAIQAERETMRRAGAASAGSVVTIVFVDIVNSTASKAGLPGSDITARNRVYFETILTPHRRRVEAELAAFGGRVVKTSGDDHFLVFGNAAQAVQWAVALQNSHAAEPIATPLGPLQVRIGMHTGAPLTDPGAIDDYIGHEVDTAKRVSSLASGGQVLLSETTAALVRDARIAGLRLHAHGEQDLKGVGRVPLFELLHGEQRPRALEVGQAISLPLEPAGQVDGQPHAIAEREEISTPVLLDALARGRIVGRDAELAELRRRIDAAVQGAGGTLFLAGEPGIGKTRLATEASVYARLRGCRVLTGRCDEEGGAPYQPFVEALREYLQAAESWRVEQAMPPPVACELVRLVPQIAGKVADIPQIPQLPPEAARQALMEAARQFFASVTTQEAPLLLFLDDLHWADEGSLAMLHVLARHARNLRLLIVGTYRDVELDTRHPLERTLSTLNRERLSERLALRRLPEPVVAQMVAAILDQPSSLPDQALRTTHHAPRTPSGFVSVLHHETEGNPFFIEEVLKHLVEEGAIYREEGRWQLKPLEAFSVPQSIKVTIGRRLERLEEASREALTLAAVIGQRFSFDLLLKASGMDEERLLDMVEEWLGAHLVVEQRQGREEVYRFQHAQIREVLYDEMSLRRKARLHERVGSALEAVYAASVEERLDELAHHFSQIHSGPTVEKAIDYCLRAGQKALQVYSNEEALQHLQAALELLDGLPDDEAHLRLRWEIVEGLVRGYRNRQEWERVQGVVRNYLALVERIGYWWGVAAVHYLLGGLNWDQGQQHLEKAVEICEQRGLDWLPLAHQGLAQVLYRRRDPDLPRAEAVARQALAAWKEASVQAASGDQLAPRSFSQLVASLQDTCGMLMEICALQGKWEEAAAAFRESIQWGGPTQIRLFWMLSAMEDAFEPMGRREGFIAFCEEGKRLLAQSGIQLPLNQWYLEPAQTPEAFGRVLFEDDFEQPQLRAEWQWQDPSQASTYGLSERPGYLTVKAARGADLWPPLNLNAPRLLLEGAPPAGWSGDFALETKMEGDWDERANRSSGLLIWKDALNFLRLDKYTDSSYHHGDVMFEARVRGEFVHIGRGRMRGALCYLRFERSGERVAGFCSADGATWFRCGQTAFPAGDSLLVGVDARAGMVAHFDYVRVLGKGNA